MATSSTTTDLVSRLEDLAADLEGHPFRNQALAFLTEETGRR